MFDFPMVESMRASIPLIVSDIPIHREICGDAALYFEMSNPENLAAQLKDLNQDPDLRKALIERAKNGQSISFLGKTI